MKQDLVLEFSRNQNKDVSMLTETHIKLLVRNNWLGLILFSPGYSQRKGLFVLLHPDLESVIEVDTDRKRRFLDVKVTLSNFRVLCVYAFSRYNTRDSWIAGISWKDCKYVWKIKVKKMKTKQYLETLIMLLIKWTGMVEIKQKNFTDMVSIMPC